MKKRFFEPHLVPVIMMCLLICCYSFKIKMPAGRQTIEPADTIASNDRAAVKKSITGFLNWYKLNFHRANSFPLLTKDSKGFYMVNRKACNDYLNCLQSSHFVSAKYISYWRRYLADKEAMLKKEKIKSDIPDGFDFDLVLITQEPEIILNGIDSIRFNFVSVKTNTALVGVKLPADTSIDYEFEMIKQSTGWQVDYIATKNYD